MGQIICRWWMTYEADSTCFRRLFPCFFTSRKIQTIALEEDDSVVVGVFNTNTDTQLLQDLSGMDEWEVRDASEIASNSPLHQAQDEIISEEGRKKFDESPWKDSHRNHRVSASVARIENHIAELRSQETVHQDEVMKQKTLLAATHKQYLIRKRLRRQLTRAYDSHNGIQEFICFLLAEQRLRMRTTASGRLTFVSGLPPGILYKIKDYCLVSDGDLVRLLRPDLNMRQFCFREQRDRTSTIPRFRYSLFSSPGPTVPAEATPVLSAEAAPLSVKTEIVLYMHISTAGVCKRKPVAVVERNVLGTQWVIRQLHRSRTTTSAGKSSPRSRRRKKRRSSKKHSEAPLLNNDPTPGDPGDFDFPIPSQALLEAALNRALSNPDRNNEETYFSNTSPRVSPHNHEDTANDNAAAAAAATTTDITTDIASSPSTLDVDVTSGAKSTITDTHHGDDSDGDGNGDTSSEDEGDIDTSDYDPTLSTELGAVLFNRNILRATPVQLRMMLPPVWMTGLHEGLPVPTSNIMQRVISGKSDSLTTLVSKNAVWVEESGSYQLNFNGRVHFSSAKNFQMTLPKFKDMLNAPILFQFGRSTEKTGGIWACNYYSLDFIKPVSLVVAFALGIIQCHSKIAC